MRPTMLQQSPPVGTGNRGHSIDLMELHSDWKFEEVPSCRVCQTGGSTVIYKKHIRSILLQFVKCSGCGLIYQNPRLTREALVKYFSRSEERRVGKECR